MTNRVDALSTVYSQKYHAEPDSINTEDLSVHREQRIKLLLSQWRITLGSLRSLLALLLEISIATKSTRIC
jgi:hypothetical protein